MKKKLKFPHGRTLEKCVYWAINEVGEHYRSTHFDIIDHPMCKMPPGRDMLPAICAAMMEWVELTKQADLKGIKWTLITYIPIEQSVETSDLILWADELLDTIGKHHVPPEMGMLDCDFFHPYHAKERVQCFSETLGTMLPDFPKIKIIYYANKGPLEIEYGESFHYWLMLIYDEKIG